MRKGDTLSRLGGDEFVVTLEGLQHAEDAAQVASKIIKALGRPFEIAGHTLNTSCSIGITIFPLDADDDRTLMKNADTAMYHAKEKGRNNYQFFSPEMNVRAVERHNLETALRLAIERQEFVLFYQPQVDIRTGRWSAWRRCCAGSTPSAAFVARHVHRRRRGVRPDRADRPMGAAQRLPARQGLAGRRLSAAQDRGQHLRAPAQQATRVLARPVADPEQQRALDPRYLELEMTESLLLQNADENIAVLRKLGQDGVRIAVDDFGTGYSRCLSAPVADRHAQDRPQLRARHRRPMRTTCRHRARGGGDGAQPATCRSPPRGWKRAAQLDALARLGCDEYQGYLFSRPLPAEAFEALLRAQPREQ